MDAEDKQMLREIHAGLNQMIPQVADTKADVHGLREDVSNLKVVNATQDERISANARHIDNVGGKIRGHMDRQSIHAPLPENGFASATVRWTFVAKVATGLTAVVGLAAILGGYLR